MDYSKLQNGSDIRGIAMENEWNEPVNLTEEAVQNLALAFAIWLSKRVGKRELKIAIGHDSRLTGEKLMMAAFAGLKSEKVSVRSYDCALASTPAMFMSTVMEPYKFDGSIMITASHLPYHRNGMKFFTNKGGLEKNEITEITSIAQRIADNAGSQSNSDNAGNMLHSGKIGTPLNTDNAGSSIKTDAEPEKIDLMSSYTQYLCKKIIDGVNAADHEHPLKGLHIVVDAGNGDGGFFESGVLRKLGADTQGSQFLEPDGHFPNHIPNPEDAKAAASIKAATLKAHADLGIIFDTDVDRAGAVLADGRTLTRNALIAVLSRIALREHPGTTIVTDSVTSSGLAEFITKHGGVHRRFKRGYKNVIDEAIRLNAEGIDSQLAIETSGHGAWKENYFLDDGAYLMVRLLIEMGKKNSLETMISDLKEPAESIELRFPVMAENVGVTSDKVLELLEHRAEKVIGWSIEKENFEGIRINADKEHGSGWLLLRKSLHEPIMPLNIESDIVGGNRMIANDLLTILRDSTGIDISVLEEFAEGH